MHEFDPAIAYQARWRFVKKARRTATVQASFPPPPTYDDVAALVAPSAPPPWLREYLKNWGPSVLLARGVAAVQPTKAVMKQRLVEVSAAAFLLNDALSDTATREFIERVGGVRFDTLGGLQHALKSIGERAKVAAESPTLSTQTGKTKKGRGRALPPEAYGAQTFCAVVIAEAWKFLRGEYPAPRNQGAAAAADAFWRASGGATTIPWGDKHLESWRPYFKRASGPEPAREREECLRHLELSKQFGEGAGN